MVEEMGLAWVLAIKPMDVLPPRTMPVTVHKSDLLKAVIGGGQAFDAPGAPHVPRFRKVIRVH